MNFVAIDFETANEKRCSPCSLGLTVVTDGKITEERYWLIKPKENRFVPMNIMIHGIRPDDVADAKEFDALWPEIEPYLTNQLVVAHNAAFDLSVIRNTLDLYQIPYPVLDYCCTMMMSKRFYPFLDNAKLNTVNQFLGYEFSHHNAAADASACANVLLEISKELGTDDIHEIAGFLGVGIGHVYPGGYRSPGATRTTTTRQHAMPNPLISQRKSAPAITAPKEIAYGSFSDQGVVFTGPLRSMSRMEAADLVERAGGSFLSSVSRKTTLLVTNTRDPFSLSSGQMSTKLRKAMELIKKGFPIEIVNEETFLSMLYTS